MNARRSALLPPQIWFAAALVLGLLSTGCATITGGAREQKVKITSTPPGAAVLVDGDSQGSTPTEVYLDRHKVHHVQIDHPGYEPFHAILKPGVNPWIFGNIAIGGVLGIVIDVCAKADHRLFPGSLHVHLHELCGPSGTPNSASPPSPVFIH